MPKLNLTESVLTKAPRPEKGYTRYWDAKRLGLVAHVQPRGTITWYFEISQRGRSQRQLIGRWPCVSIDAARMTALELEHATRRGAARAMKRQDVTLREAVAEYCARPKLRSASHKKFLGKLPTEFLRDWADMPLHEVTLDMVTKRHTALASRGATTANKVIEALRTVWNFARRTRSYLGDAPTTVEWHEEPAKAESADRLNKPIADLAAWRAEVDVIPNEIHRAVYRLALLTGMRRSEVLSLTWSQVLDAEKLIYLPVNKSARPFYVPIGQAHLDVLAQTRGLDDHWVFPSPKAKKAGGHVTGDGLTRVSAGTFHSLRHSFFATGTRHLNLLEETVGRLLNHSTGTFSSRYGKVEPKDAAEALRPTMNAIVDKLIERLNAG